MEYKLYVQYAEVIKSIETLESFRDTLKIKILETMENDRVKSDFGIFTRYPRSTWQYSDKVDALTEKVKLQQYKEQKNGTAKEVVTTHLRFIPIKE